MLDRLHMTMSFPSMLEGPVRLKRAHRRIVKECVREELQRHHLMRIPGHFRRPARHKYDHMERGSGYKAKKKRYKRSVTDLVYSGRTKFHMVRTKKRLRVSGGTRRQSTVLGRLVLGWPFPVGRTPPGVKVTPRKMAGEIETITPDEQQEIVDGFARRYFRKLNTELKQRTRRVDYRLLWNKGP